MAGIQEYLDLIKNAVYGRDVRQAIHDSIHQCYEDGKAGATDLIARETISQVDSVLSARIDELIAPSGEAPSAAEVNDARIGADGTTYTSLGDAIRNQVFDLKSSTDAVAEATATPLNIARKGIAPAQTAPITLATNILLKAGVTYSYSLTIASASDQAMYLHLRNSSDTSVSSLTLNAGDTTKSKNFTPSEDVEVSVKLYDFNRSKPYTIAIEDTTSKTLAEIVAENTADIEELFEELDMPLNLSFKGELANSTAIVPIAENIQLKSGKAYHYSFSIGDAIDQQAILYVRDVNNQVLSSVNINAGETTKSKNYTAEEDVTVSLAIYDANRAISYEVKFADITDKVVLKGDLPQSLQPITIAENIQLKAGETYNYRIVYDEPIDQQSIFYIWDGNGDRVSSVNLKAGETIKSKNYTPTVNVNASIGIYNANRALTYTVEIANTAGNSVPEVIKRLIESPVESFPQYIRHSLASHSVGSFRQPYLCLSCDDGTAGLQTYTIPMLMQKNVPCTFGLWSTSSRAGESPSYQPSVILQSEVGVQTLLNAIENGCTVAQHGNINWTDLREEELNDFFDREQSAFTELGITVKGAICPSHCVDDRVRAIVGGRFNSVRAGYNGFLSTEDANNHIPGDVVNPYIYYLTGAHSNCYSFTSYNVIDSDKDLDYLKTALDYAIANDMVMIVYWHDWNFIDSDANYLANRAKLEAFIDYAKTTSVTFTTLDKIPSLK